MTIPINCSAKADLTATFKKGSVETIVNCTEFKAEFGVVKVGNEVEINRVNQGTGVVCRERGCISCGNVSFS